MVVFGDQSGVLGEKAGMFCVSREGYFWWLFLVTSPVF